jgi:hypothetical protein
MSKNVIPEAEVAYKKRQDSIMNKLKALNVMVQHKFDRDSTSPKYWDVVGDLGRLDDELDRVLSIFQDYR